MKRYRIIQENSDHGIFLLIDTDTDTFIRCDPNPKALSRWAFGFGDADVVRHDYDLKLAEDLF